MGKAPAPAADNAGCLAERGGKWRVKPNLRMVPGFLSGLQGQVVRLKCHLLERDGATQLLLLQDPLFLQCQPGSEQTKAPPPPGSSAPPSSQTGQTRAFLPYFVSPETQTWAGSGPPTVGHGGATLKCRAITPFLVHIECKNISQARLITDYS